MKITRITSFYDPCDPDYFELEIATDIPDGYLKPSESVDDIFDSFFTLPCETYDELIALGRHSYFQRENYFEDKFRSLRIQTEHMTATDNDTEHEKHRLWWSYTESYTKFVCDYLNQDFISLAGASDFELENEEWWLRSWADELMRYAPTSPRYDKCMREILEYVPEYKKYVAVAKTDLEQLKFDDVKQMVDTIFIDDTYPALTVEQKYYAFGVSYYKKDGVNIEYEAIIRAHGADKETTSNLSNEMRRELDILGRLERKKINPKEQYQQLCQMLLESNVRVGVYESRDFHTLKDCVLYFLYEMIKQNIILKICPNCGKYFVPKVRSDTIYCTNKAPQDKMKTCQEYRKYINYLTKTQNNEATKLYKQIFNQKANKVRRCKTVDNPLGNPKLNADFEMFQKDAKQWKSDVKAETRTEAEYIEWLRAVKERKVL